MKEEDLKTVMTLHFKESESQIPSIDLHEELISRDDVDEDLERSHVMYGFCVVLGAEFEHKANVLDAKLDTYMGEQWGKLKGAITKRYTDNDAKRKIESDPWVLSQRIKISKYRKFSKQLTFGGGKALEIKAKSVHTRIYKLYRAYVEDFGVREEKDVKSYVKERIKRRDKHAD
jgi:hypothetical protein